MTATILARCVRGLEWVAAEEITSRLPKAEGISVSARAVTFRIPSLTPSLSTLRTIDDAFIEVGVVRDVGTTKDVPALLAKRLADLDWAGWLSGLRSLRPIADKPRFDVVASLDGRRRYNRFAVENTLGQLLEPLIRGSYLARTAEGRQTGDPDLTVRILLQGPQAVAALRLGARPLHRRAYKQDTGAGTLHPPVAAALARMVAPGPKDFVLDPFCGDGTIAIETALCYRETRVTGSDIDPARLANARNNATRAAVAIELAEAGAGRWPSPEHAMGAVITNPPWNVAVDARGLLSRSLNRFWRRLPELLTSEGRVALIADLDMGAPAQLRSLAYAVPLASQIRLAGRVSQVIFCAPPECAPPQLPAELLIWRERALATGVITDEGF